MSATPLPTTVFALALICQVLLHALVSARPLVSWPWRAAGIFLVAFGLIFNLIADRQFKRARTPVRPRDTPAVLVTDGVFAWSRNPMYTGMVVLLLGVAILLGTLTPFVVPALFAWLVARVFIRPEEATLRRAFGEAYERYAKHVRRWM